MNCSPFFDVDSNHSTLLDSIISQHDNLITSGNSILRWIELAKNNQGVRSVSPDWWMSLDKLLLAFGLGNSESRFGLYKLDPWIAWSLGSSKCKLPEGESNNPLEFSIDTMLLERNSPTGKYLEQINPQLLRINYRLKVLFLVNISLRAGKLSPLGAYNLFREIESQIPDQSLSLREKIFLANFESFLCVRTKDLAHAEYILDGCSQSLISKLSNRVEHRNYLANFQYQMYQISKIRTKDSKARGHLRKAIHLDPSYYAYHYLLAQDLHDLGDPLSYNCYLNAIVRSPFDFSLVNDFGILLREINSPEFDSWKRVCSLIFKDEEQ